MKSYRKPLFIATIMIVLLIVEMFSGITTREQLIFVLFCLVLFLLILIKKSRKWQTEEKEDEF